MSIQLDCDHGDGDYLKIADVRSEDEALRFEVEAYSKDTGHIVCVYLDAKRTKQLAQYLVDNWEDE